MSRVRNPVARSPLLRKGGPHERPASGVRAERRKVIEAGIDAYHGVGDKQEAGRRKPR